MKIIESIKKFWKDFGVTRTKERSEPRLYLRRGPLEKILACHPNYIGELLLCTDKPSLYTWNGSSWCEIPLPTRAQYALSHHYNVQELAWAICHEVRGGL